MKNDGLRKKPTYDSLIDYIQNKQPILKYPDRLATQIMNSRELGNLDKIGMIGMEEQQQNIMKEQQREVIITQQANSEGSTAKKIRSMNTQKTVTKVDGPKPVNVTGPIGSNIFDMTMDDNMDDYMNDVEAVIIERNKKKLKK